MRPRPFLLLLAGFALALMVVGEADAEKEPEWSYTTGSIARSVSISADGEYIAASSYDNKVYLFDKDSSTPLWSYTTGDIVLSVAISADGEYIVAGSYDNKVYLFDKDSSTPLWSYTTGGEVLSVAISADGEYIAAGSIYDSKVYLFDKDSSTPLWSYETGDGVVSVAFSVDGEYIVAGSDKVYLFNKDNSTPLWSYDTWVHSVAISADGEYIAAAGSDKVYLFDKDSSTPLWNYDTDDSVVSVAISADGEYIAAGSGSGDDKVYLFGNTNGTPLWSYTTGNTVYSVAISADGEYIAAGSSDDKVYLFDKDSSTPIWSYTAGDSVGSVSISADSGYIAAGSVDYKVYLFDKNIPPTATIDSITPSPARFDAEVTFSGSGSDSDGTVVAYEWNCALDGNLSDETDFSITGLSIGYHNISFRVQDNDGEWSDWKNTTLTVNPNAHPVAIINSLIPSSTARFDEIITFSGTGTDSDGTVVAYEWISSKDGLLSSEEEFSSNLGVGIHNISFRVQDNDGAWSEANLVIGSSGKLRHPDGGDMWAYSTVTEIVSVAPYISQVTVKISWGDDLCFIEVGRVTVNFSSPSEQLVADLEVYAHHYEDFSWSAEGEIGEWVIELEKEFDGFCNTISYELEWELKYVVWEITILPNELPVPLINDVSSSSAEKGTSVDFSGDGTDSDGTIISYLWNSSIDGELSTERDFSSSDLSLGHHTITFRVQDNDEMWSDIHGSLWIYAVPVAIAGDDATVVPGGNVQFSGAATDDDGTIAKYEWDFDGDGVFEWSSTESGLTTLIYNDKGTYNAVLRVTDNDGFTSTDTRRIHVSTLGIDPASLVKDNLVYILILFGLIGGFVYWKNKDDYTPSSKSSPVTPPPPTRSAPMFSPSPSMTAIECPGCNAQMKVPKLGKMQTVTCDSCGLSGEIEV